MPAIGASTTAGSTVSAPRRSGAGPVAGDDGRSRTLLLTISRVGGEAGHPALDGRGAPCGQPTGTTTAGTTACCSPRSPRTPPGCSKSAVAPGRWLTGSLGGSSTATRSDRKSVVLGKSVDLG